MGRLLKFGCFGAVALVALIIVVAVVAGNQPRPQQQVSGEPGQAKQQQVGGEAKAADPGKAELARVGQTASLRGWEVTLLDLGQYDRFSAGKPPATKGQGLLVVPDMRIKNLQNSTSNFTTNDFTLRSGDGREFKPAAQTASIDRGFLVAQTVQPGLTTENRVVFDIAPDAKDLVFTALGVQFSVPAPG
jgi:Domain of unknown function (DUF4352)